MNDFVLTRKSRLLFSYLEVVGGGVVDELRIRDATGLSHGSICAARKELIEIGVLEVAKKFRKLIYILHPEKVKQEASRSVDQSKQGGAKK